MAAGDEIISATRALIDHVYSRVGEWRFDDECPSTAAAGLHRASQLLSEALDLATNPPSAGANILVRSAFEYYLVGTYALFGGYEALFGIERARHQNETTLASRVGDQRTIEYLRNQLVELEKAEQRLLGRKANPLVLEQVARRLGPMATSATSDEVDLMPLYDTLYRSHSTNDAHPAKTIGMMVFDDVSGGMRVRPIDPWLDPVHSIGSLAMFIGQSGGWLEERIGGDPSEWNDLVLRLISAFTADS